MNSSFVFVELNDLSARVNYILNPICCMFVLDLSFPHVILQFMHGKEALFLGMSPPLGSVLHDAKTPKLFASNTNET